MSTPNVSASGASASHGETVTVPETWGLVGYLRTPADLYKACEALRDAGYKKFDAHTPFPVHGLENAMGLKPSKLPFIVFGAALTGAASALAMMVYMNVIDYPMNIGGKPYLTLPSYVPITFELTILFSAFAAFFGCWGLNLLPKFFDPVMQHPQFARATDDLFFVAVEATDPNFDVRKTRALLEGLGVKDLQEVAP
jgi:hypothetical protein